MKVVILFLFITILSSENLYAFFPKTLSFSFEQVTISTISGKERKSLGVLEYRYPGQIRFEILNPEASKSIFVSNNIKSWYYTPPFVESEKGEVIVQSAGKLELTKLLDLMKSGLKDNKHYTVKRGNYQIEFLFSKILQDRLKVLSLTLIMNDKASVKIDDLKKLVINYSEKKKVVLNIKELKKDIIFKVNHFDFKIPKNTQITEN